jgi:hypothetical protein
MQNFIFGQNTMRIPFDVDEQESEFRSQKPELERGKYDLLCEIFDLQFCHIKISHRLVLAKAGRTPRT